MSAFKRKWSLGYWKVDDIIIFGLVHVEKFSHGMGCGWDLAGVTSFQKIYRLYGLKHRIVEISEDVTKAGLDRRPNEQGKIGLLYFRTGKRWVSQDSCANIWKHFFVWGGSNLSQLNWFVIFILTLVLIRVCHRGLETSRSRGFCQIFYKFFINFL